MSRRMMVLLEFDRPKNVPFADIRDFIIEWLEGGGGCRHPDDPLFDSLPNVKVSKPIASWREPGKP